MDHTMVSFNELVSAEKRILIRKLISKIAEFYSTFENQTFKEYFEKISSNLEALAGGLEQKIPDEFDTIQIFDIALRYLLENVN